jgi:hypothetical protein
MIEEPAYDDAPYHDDADRQRQEELWLTEEDHRIIRMAKERFEEAFYTVFGGNNDTAR